MRIGDGTVIREYVTIHRATTPEGWTEIGRDCLLMGQAHVAHDCRLGDGVIVINYAGITGHCQIGDRATIGGLAGIVPFTRIGTCAYIGGCAKVAPDVPPYLIVEGQPATARGRERDRVAAGRHGAGRRGGAPGRLPAPLPQSGSRPGAALERDPRGAAAEPARDHAARRSSRRRSARDLLGAAAARSRAAEAEQVTS